MCSLLLSRGTVPPPNTRLPQFTFPNPTGPIQLCSVLQREGGTAQSWDLWRNPLRASHQGFWLNSSGTSRRCAVRSLPMGLCYPIRELSRFAFPNPTGPILLGSGGSGVQLRTQTYCKQLKS